MQLKDYIKGNRRGKEANRLEREAMNDPFLRDALDGFDSVAGDHAEIIEQFEEKYTSFTVIPESKNKAFFYWAAAASILLLIGFGTYFFWFDKPSSYSNFAYHIPPEKNDNIISEVYIEETPSENLIAEKAPIIVNPAQKIPPAVPAVLENKLQANNEDAIDLSDLAESRVVVETEAEYSPELMFREQEKQTIRGRVVDETGNPLIGVSIVAQGTPGGAVSGIDGVFNFQLPAGDSSKLIASYIGYESQEINPFDTNQTVTLKPDNLALNEVVVVGYGTQMKSETTGSITGSNAGGSAQIPFGEKEFQTWCKQKVDKNVCAGKGVSVKATFFINETGKPANIEFQKYSCEDAKKEIENLLSSSPVWTKTNRKVTMTVKW